MTWNLVPGRVLILGILHMLHHFDPPFSGLWKVCLVSTPIFEQKTRKMWYFDPFLSKLGKMYCLDPLFLPFVAMWVKGRCWASLSETQPRPPPPAPGWVGGGGGGRWWSIGRANYMYVHVKSRTIAEGYPYGWPTKPILHTFESQGCVQLGWCAAMLCVVRLGCVEGQVSVSVRNRIRGQK